MNYQTTIGLEIHVQLKTKSKMFCSCDNKADEAKPNTLVCPVCLGLPGVLPVANSQAIEWTIKTGLALGSKIAKISKFDRKHYFYPDLPKNYQISQYDHPFCQGGYLEIETPKGLKKINLIRIHLEEDAGKLLHPKDADYSLIDLNRAGTPLMEIVTGPEINSPEEAKIFMQELRAILRFLDVSDADMEKGHLRCDANISLGRVNSANNQKVKLGTPVEIKNINSFKMVERALSYEEKRQKQLIENGEKVVKETRGWNDNQGVTYSQRSKEFAQDYRYFPEPDIPPFALTGFDLVKIKAQIPEMPALKRKRYLKDLGISRQDASILALDRQMAGYFEKVALKVSPKLAANWIINEIKIRDLAAISPEKMIELLTILQKSEISGKIAKLVLAEMIATGKGAGSIIKEKGLKQVGDSQQLTLIVEKIINQNPQAATDFQQGKVSALGFLVGQVMRKTQGQANPQLLNDIIKAKLKGKNG